MKREQDLVDDIADEPAFDHFSKWSYRENRIGFSKIIRVTDGMSVPVRFAPQEKYANQDNWAARRNRLGLDGRVLPDYQ